jgi:hypothetical protein
MLIDVNPVCNSGSAESVILARWFTDIKVIPIPLSDDCAMSVEAENSRRSVMIRK